MAMIDRSAAPQPRRAHGKSGKSGALAVTTRDGAVLVLLVGDLGDAEAGQLRRRLVEELRGAPLTIVVDASAATWLCAQLVAVLEEITGLIETSGGHLLVVDPPPALTHQLRRCGIRCRTTRIGASGRPVRAPGTAAGLEPGPAADAGLD